MKSQSAMEYLMTYGWAIIVIAVVLGALYEVGVFNPTFLAQKMQPGSCTVLHSGISGGSSATLEGSCNRGVPQTVAQFNGNGYVQESSGTYVNYSSYTITLWFQTTSSGDEKLVSSDGSNHFQTFYGNMRICSYGASACFVGTKVIDDGAWHFVAAVGTKTYVKVYVDGSTTPDIDTAAISGSTSGIIRIGSVGAGTGSQSPTLYFIGKISNVQIYNKSLPLSDIISLYKEGIVGAPIEPAYIAAWWPLNGNAKDYSGNGNSGAATNVGFTGTWENGYVSP